MKVCSIQGCPELTKSSHCDAHVPKAHGWASSTRVTPPGWGEKRRRILRRDKHRCVICSRRATVVDHLLPMAWGGAPMAEANLRAMCPRCHDSKTTQERILGKTLKRLGGGPERDALLVEFVASWQA